MTLISIGIVDERGGEFYAVSSDFRKEDCSEWVKANVLPHLVGQKRLPLHDIAILVREWVDVQCEDSKPEFWGYYADYDWVVTAQMFGTMMDLPKGWPMYCRDLKQLCDDLGNPALPEQGKGEHNALADARWNKLAYAQLKAKGNAVGVSGKCDFHGAEPIRQRIREAEAERDEQQHSMHISRGYGRIFGRCKCGWFISQVSQVSAEEFVQSAAAEHLLHFNRTPPHTEATKGSEG